MKIPSSVMLTAFLFASAVAAAEAPLVPATAAEPAPCETGVFRKDQTTFVAVTSTDKGYNYTFNDGIAGNTQDADAIVACAKGAVVVANRGSWLNEAVVETDTRFVSNGVMLAGRLMAPPGADRRTPLVVYAHGSEGSGWIGRARDPYQMVGRGIAVFVYDKRGTGLSQGEYTQNFPRLADDLVAASREARRLAAGRFGRFGLIGLSQGGWIVPLAAPRAKAEFIGIAYGLAIDIAQQDAAQVSQQLRALAYGDDVIDMARKATDITATIARSGGKDGLDALEQFQRQFGKEPWFSQIKGGFSGVLLGMPVADLRKQGLAQFDKLDIDWSLDPIKIVGEVDVAQLWAFAEEDRQAPGASTVQRLSRLREQGRDIAIYSFPGADHGMWMEADAAGGARKRKRIAPGFYDLMADWAKGRLVANYGKAQRQ